MPILSAASPVEIEAKADAMALPAPARAAALALFHGLTSREELAALALPDGPGHHDGTEWPMHGFLFGAAAEMVPVLDGLRRLPDAAELAAGGEPEGPMPRTLFVTGGQNGFTGVLLACADAGLLAEAMTGMG